MRFGEFSRAPLKLLRLEWKPNLFECDWLMRPADAWDINLPANLVEEHQTQQALRDALSLRDMVFVSFPDVDCAELRMFRCGSDQVPELVMTGSVRRADEALTRVASVAMRAKLCGFNFNLAGGVLERRTPISLGCS